MVSPELELEFKNSEFRGVKFAVFIMSKMKKARMGRPPYKASERRSKQAVIRFRPEELKLLEAEAWAAGMGLAT